MLDDYVTIERINPDTYRGQVRNIFTGKVWECEHSHRTRSTARECAKRYANEHGIDLEPNNLGAR